MISLSIKSTKQFMSLLLVKETFDKLHLSEATIATANTFSINGSINKAYYSKDELEELALTDNESYANWESIKSLCFSMVKGNKVPTAMKIVFLMPKAFVNSILETGDYGISTDDINGMFININYSSDGINVVTGTSLKLFTLDKSLDKAFDSYVKQFFSENAIDFEEL